MAPMRALMTPAKRMERSISPDRPCVWLRCWLPAGLGAPADSREPASSTKAFTCAWHEAEHVDLHRAASITY